MIMQKYDDFGRPIYETAEEYNRAHRTGGMSYTYDSPKEDAYEQKVKRQTVRHQTVEQCHATREGSKKAKTLVLGIVAFVIVLNIAIIFSMSNMVGSAVAEPEIDYDNTWVEDEAYVEYPNDVEIPLPEGFEKFSYNGHSFTLPTTYKEIAKLGYDLDGYEPTDMIPSGFWDIVSLLDEDGYMVAMISVTNNTEEDILFEECTVNYFYIDNPTRYDETVDVPDFVFGDGLTLESSYDEVEAYLGIPYFHYEDYSDEDYLYDSFQWEYYGEDERQFVMVNFVNDEILDISIEKDVYEE